MSRRPNPLRAYIRLKEVEIDRVIPTIIVIGGVVGTVLKLLQLGGYLKGPVRWLKGIRTSLSAKVKERRRKKTETPREQLSKLLLDPEVKDTFFMLLHRGHSIMAVKGYISIEVGPDYSNPRFYHVPFEMNNENKPLQTFYYQEGTAGSDYNGCNICGPLIAKLSGF